MPWMLPAAIVGSAALNYFGSQQAGNAANNAANINTAAQMQMNTQNIQAQKEMQAQNLAQQDKWNTLNDPFAASGARTQFVQPLTDLAKGGINSIFADPTYQAMTTQGSNAISRTMASRGLTSSGQELTALGSYNQGFALDAYKTRLSELMSLSGASTPGQAYHGMAPQGAILQPQITPGMAYNMAAQPWSAGASTLGTLASIYGQPSGGNYTGGSPSLSYQGGGSSLGF